MYWLLFVSCFGFVVYDYAIILGGRFASYHFRLPGGYDSTFALALISPYLKNGNKTAMAIALLCFSVIILSFSRGAWIACVPIMFYLGSNYRRSKRGLIVLLPILIALFYFSSQTFRQLISWRFATAFDTESASNIERLGMAGVALSAFYSSPIFGIGALNYPSYLMANSDWGIIRSEVVTNLTPHNFFLEILAELGLFGFCAFSAILLSVFLSLRYAYKIRHYEAISRLQLQGLTVLVVVFIISITLGYVAGHFRLYMALLFGGILTYTRIGHADN